MPNNQGPHHRPSRTTYSPRLDVCDYDASRAMRIVQDSEDEEEFEVEEGAANATKPSDASVPAHTNRSPQRDAQGTGSTESLKRAIKAAHREHFRSPSSRSSGHQRENTLEISNSPLESASKRRKTSPDGFHVQSSMTSSAKKRMPVTYGRRQTAFDSPFHMHTAHDMDPPQAMPTVEMPWNLPGSIREEWQHHEPLAMFPDPSSTIPNATATQQQLLGEVLAPAFLGIEPDSDAPKYEPAKSSVPWSDFLKSSARNTEDHSELTNPSGEPFGPQQSSIPQADAGSQGLDAVPAISATHQSSQGSRNPSTSQSKGSFLRNDLGADGVDRVHTMAPPSTNSQERGNEPAPMDIGAALKPDKTLSNAQVVDDEQRRVLDQPQKSQIDLPVLSQPARGKKKINMPSSEDDLVNIGLPKEQYKPRPSRSRSQKLAAEEPMDYSIRPESAAKKTRRGRTSGAIPHASACKTPEKMQQICDMGFTPSTTQRALRQNGGDVTQTVDWLIANGVADEDELAPPRSSKSRTKRKRSKQEVAQDQLVGGAKDDEPTNPVIALEEASEQGLENAPIAAATKSPRVKIVIPKSKEQFPISGVEEQQPTIAATQMDDLEDDSHTNTKRTKITVNKYDVPLEKSQQIVPVTQKAKKRGRGRPRKEAKTAESVPEKQIDELQPKLDDRETVVHDTNPNASANVEEMLGDEQQREAIVEETAAVIELSKSPAPAEIIRAQTSKESARTPDPPSNAAHSNQSPMTSKGKVSYRVGLSKRVRIAPLLRVVKK